MNIEQNIWVIGILVFFFFLFQLNKMVLPKEDYKILNPISILLGIWSITIIVHATLYTFVEYSCDMYISVIVSVQFFALGFWLMRNKVIVCEREAYLIDYDLDELKKILRVFTFISFARCLLMTSVVYKVAGSLQMFFTQNTLVRNMYLSRENSIQTYFIELPLSMLTMVGFVVLGIYLGVGNENRLRYLGIWTIFEFIVSYVTMSKLNMILYGFVVIFTYFNFVGEIGIQKRIIKRLVPVILIALLAFLFIIANQRNYQETEPGWQFVIRKAFMYIASPFEAYGKFLEEYERNQLVINVTDVGDGRTNVFTWLKAFVQYLSYAGIAVCPGVMGMIAGALYNPREKNIFWITASAWTNCMIFMSFYSYLWVHLSYFVCIPLSFIINVIVTKKMYYIVEQSL